METLAKQRIKGVVKYHFGFDPEESDIEWIDKMLSNSYGAMHEQRVIGELATNNLTNGLLKHRDRLGSLEFERIWLEKHVFKYLTFASMCFRAGIPAGTISLCRTAIESGIRERLAEELARKEVTDESSLPRAIRDNLSRLEHNVKLWKLIDEAKKNGVLGGQDIEEAFQELGGREILDKFIHGDVVWMVNFAKGRKKVEVIGAKDELQEYKIISEGEISQIAFKALKASYGIAEILYFKN